MTEKIAKLVKELQEKNEELNKEINSLSKTNLSLLDNLKVEKGFKINLRPMVTGSFQIKKPEVVRGSGKSKTTGKDYNQIVLDLVDEGFFRQPVGLGDIYEITSKRGIVLSSRIKGLIRSKLRTLTKSKRLAKFKQGADFVYQER